MNLYHEIAYRIDPVCWMRNVLGMTPRGWQEEFLRVALGQDVLVLTARASRQDHRGCLWDGAYRTFQARISIRRGLSGPAAKCRTAPQGARHGHESRRRADQ